jgi:hypothetical protein
MNIIRLRRSRPARPDESRESDGTLARNPRRRARVLMFGGWLPALWGAVTLRQGGWLS